MAKPRKKTKTKKNQKVKRTMTKADLVHAVMADAKDDDVWSKAQVERIVESVFDNIVKIVNDDNKLFIYQFGTFQKTTLCARSYTTVSGTVDKPERKKFVLRPSKTVKDAMNE